jgi:hypothetical protein
VRERVPDTASDRTRQAHRGHVTRELLKELDAVIRQTEGEADGDGQD